METKQVFLLCDNRKINYNSVINALKNGDSRAELLISLRDWLFSVLDFDPQTGEVMASDMTSFLDRIWELKKCENGTGDWIHKILKYCSPSILKIFESPRTEILRFHQVQPVYHAREIDSAGLMDISRRPGRTVREKISMTQKVLAVKREQSVDTSENRLLKTFCLRLLDFLEIREDLQDSSIPKEFSENEDSFCSILYNRIRRWLKSEDAETIGKWQNLSPNNILLCDKYYKKIWKSYRDLQELNDLVESDWENLDSYCAVYTFWKTLSFLQHDGAKIFQSPIEGDYKKFTFYNFADDSSENCSVHVDSENFSLELKNRTISFKPKNKNEKSHKIEVRFSNIEIDGKSISDKAVSILDFDKIARKISSSIIKTPCLRKIPVPLEKAQEFAAVDFAESEKSYSVSSEKKSRTLPFRLYRQFWQKNGEKDFVNLDCATSPALYSGKKGDYALLDIDFDSVLYGKQVDSDFKNQATYDFMYSFKNFFNTNSLYYLLPDYIEDFSLSALRAAANSVFAQANPVPRSIGAVFALQFSEKYSDCLDSLREDDFVFVIEKKEKLFSLTPIQVKKSFEVKNRNLSLNDFPDANKIPHLVRWEHHPAIIFDDYESNKIAQYILEAAEKTEAWKKSGRNILISPETSIKNAVLHLPQNWKFINEAFSAVEGICNAAELQKIVPEIPLWCEHLPVLQMTVIKNGRRKGINLTQGKTVLPLRGKKQEISIPDVFTLSKRVDEYHFRLSRGCENSESILKYEAFLKSHAFPLKADTKCTLKMSYTYGEEQPFELAFVPQNSGEFIQAKVDWKEIDESKFPVPNFPPERKWSEFVTWLIR